MVNVSISQAATPMILNAYAVLDGFVLLLRLLLGCLVFALSLAYPVKECLSITVNRKDREDRFYFLFLSAIVLLALNIACWPLFYMLLQSYVSQWPGVMCIYGVTRVGAGSQGASR